MRRLLFCCCILLCCCLATKAQKTVRDTDFTQVDERAVRIEGTDTESIVKQLIATDTAEILKVRAIFRWITEHIAYDVEGRKIEDPYAGLSPDLYPVHDGLSVTGTYDERAILYILKERKAICYGYAILFRKMCRLAGIKAFVVNGYAKTSDDPIGKSMDINHAWNVVEISGQPYLLDATWASGYTDTKFKKEFSEHYFLTPPVEFILNHYPEQIKWSLLKSPPNKETFFSFPIVLKDKSSPGFNSLLPTNGIITCKRGEKVSIQFKSKTLIQSVELQAISDNNEIVASNLNEAGDPVFEMTDGKVVASFIVPKQKIAWLDVVVNGERILRYAIKVTY